MSKFSLPMTVGAVLLGLIPALAAPAQRDSAAVSEVQSALAALGGIPAIAQIADSTVSGTRQANDGGPPGSFTFETLGSEFRRQIQNAGPSLPVLSDFSSEYRAYQTSIFATSALGAPDFTPSYGGQKYALWNGSWGEVDKNITNFVSAFHDKQGRQTNPETQPHNPWSN